MKQWKYAAPGHAPPRLALAAAAALTTALLHGGLLGLYQSHTPRQQLLATPALERQLAACRAQAGRAEQRRCQLAVAERARAAPALTVVARR